MVKLKRIRTIVYYTKRGETGTYSRIFYDDPPVEATVFMRKMESKNASRRLCRHDTTFVEPK